MMGAYLMTLFVADGNFWTWVCIGDLPSGAVACPGLILCFLATLKSKGGLHYLCSQCHDALPHLRPKSKESSQLWARPAPTVSPLCSCEWFLSGVLWPWPDTSTTNSEIQAGLCLGKESRGLEVMVGAQVGVGWEDWARTVQTEPMDSRWE